MKCQLFINGQAVDISDDTLILWTYAFDDITMPTAIRNPYTKEVTLEGTPTNNAIFNDIYRHDFTARGGDFNLDYNDDYSIIDFAPNVRTPFRIYNEASEMLVKGYMKLSSVRRVKGHVTYGVTLYGDLGRFLLSLMYDDNGEKLTLADLNWYAGATPLTIAETALDRQLVREAWEWLVSAVTPTTHPWLKAVNFAPCYNGLPEKENFDADKVLVDLNTVTTLGIPSSETVDGVTYDAHNGFVLARLKEGYTEQEILDCRAHLQRPVVKIEHFFDSLIHTSGYTIALDADFFAAANKYYSEAWMTLPMLKEAAMVKPTAQDATATAAGASPWGWTAEAQACNFTEVQRVTSRPALSVKVQINATTYGCSIADGYFGLMFLAYYDVDANRIGNSMLFVLYSTTQPLTADVSNALALIGEDITDFTVIYSQGRFDSAGTWIGTNTSGGLGVMPVYVDNVVGLSSVGVRAYVPNHLVYSGAAVTLTSAQAVMGGALYGYPLAGRTVTKDALLGGTATPADYLLAYCKQFNLRLIVDEASKTVNIVRCEKFFTGEVVDIQDRIDRNREVNIQPLAAETRWFTMTQAVEGANAKRYADMYGHAYGRVRIDTGYPFNDETKELCGDSVLKGAVQTQARSRKMAFPLLGNESRRSWQEFEHTLVYGIAGATTEVKDEGFSPSAYEAYNSAGLLFYDDTDLPQLCDENDKAVDGAGVLLFLSGAGRQVWLTDDLNEMLYQNGANACWLITEDATIAEHIYQPHFSRNYPATLVGFCMEYAVPKEIYTTLVTSLPAGATVYNRRWQKFIEERYDDDTRVVTCYVNLRGWKVGTELLRPFYWWDNCLWVLNKINDYDMTGEGATLCEFVKVNDPTNYSEDYNGY